MRTRLLLLVFVGLSSLFPRGIQATVAPTHPTATSLDATLAAPTLEREAVTTTASLQPASVRADKRTQRRERRFARLAKRVAAFVEPVDKGGPGAGLAVAGLFTGIVSLFVFGIPLGILSVVFGAISLSKAKKGLHGRKSMATAALILGIAGIIGGIIAIAILA